MNCRIEASTLRPAPKATLAQVADHVEHVRKVAGIEDYPALLAELLRRGWTDEDVKKLAGGNVLRVLRETDKVAERLRKERGPSDALIEVMDGAKEEKQD